MMPINCIYFNNGMCACTSLGVSLCLEIHGQFCPCKHIHKNPPAPPNFQRSIIVEETKETIEKELQIEKCLKLSVELWEEYNKLPVEHPNQINEFGAAIHVIQEKLALKIARIYRPDLYPNKMKEE